VFAQDGGFEVVFRNNEAYVFTGKFHGVNEDKDFTAVGMLAHDQCFVTILRNGPVVTFADEYTSPYLVTEVDDKKIEYFTESFDRLTFKKLDRATGDTTVIQVYEIPYDEEWSQKLSCS